MRYVLPLAQMSWTTAHSFLRASNLICMCNCSCSTLRNISFSKMIYLVYRLILSIWCFSKLTIISKFAPVFLSAQETAFGTLFYQHQLFLRLFILFMIVFFYFSILPSTGTPRLALGRFSSLTFKRRSFPTHKWVFSSQHIMIQFKKCTLY